MPQASRDGASRAAFGCLASVGRVGVLVILAALFPARSSAAVPVNAEAPIAEKRMILLIGARQDPVFMRLRAELRSLGFVVETVKDTEASSLGDVESAARGLDAVAAIQVDRGNDRVAIWTPDRASGRMSLASALSIEPDAALVALRAVEALRTSLIDVEGLVPARPAKPARPARDEPRATPVWSSISTPPSFGWSFGPAFAASPGRIGASWHILVSGHWMPEPRIGLEAWALAPLTAARWNEAEGSATFTFGMVALGGRFRPIVARRWSADVSAGLGGTVVHGQGTPSGDQFSGDGRTTVIATPFARVGSRWALGAAFWLRADVIAAIAWPRLRYTVADRVDESWGAPLVVGSIGLEMGTAERRPQKD